MLLEVQGVPLQNAHASFHRRDRPLAPAAQAFLDHLREVERELRRAEARPARPRRA